MNCSPSNCSPSTRTTSATKEPQLSSIFVKTGIMSLERAFDVLDKLGSTMRNSQTESGIASNTASRRNKASILAFEVANTIVKGSNLLQSLSEENIQFLKNEILHSDTVVQLVSTDMAELLKIAACDKREELNVFSREVCSFGDLCIDPQWHNLSRYFSTVFLGQHNKRSHGTKKQKEADMAMQELLTLAQYTSELYHELHALDRSELVYRRKMMEMESLHHPQRGEGLQKLHSELKHQRKLVKNLKKKSLWSKSLEEVVEKLVDIVTFIHQLILEVFGDNVPDVLSTKKKPSIKPERLGISGLALHYAHIITQIDDIASCPTSLDPYMRDKLYNDLPVNVKNSLRWQLLQLRDVREDLSIPQIKAEMEKTLRWLVPVAAETIKVHQEFGWVGEWAYTGMFGKKTTNNSVIRLQTLYHADKEHTEQCIRQLVIWLHRLILISNIRA